MLSDCIRLIKICHSCNAMLLFSELLHKSTITNVNEKSTQRDANTACELAVVRFGHRLPARCHKPIDGTEYNTLHRS